jgi:transcriptional regulator with XRE-family HTH domain
MSDAPDLHFGKRLRLERERRRITLDSIAANTKIGVALLKGLERDDVSRWPSGIFRRSFIREYAAAIGLDPDETAREFLERYPDPGDEVWTRPAPVKMADSPVLRLTLADTGSWFVRGVVLADVWRRWAAVAWDLAMCLAIGGVLFLVLGQWWKPLAVTLIGYYAFSILLLGNTPGVFFFARLATLEHAPGGLSSLARRLRRALTRLRRKLPFFRHDASRPSPKPVRRAPTPFPGRSATEHRDARGH